MFFGGRERSYLNVIDGFLNKPLAVDVEELPSRLHDVELEALTRVPSALLQAK